MRGKKLVLMRKTGTVRAVKAPGLTWERRAWTAGKSVVAGVDEVGRGAWAGPLVAAAIALPREPQARARLTRAFNHAHASVRDSKQLKVCQRELIARVLLDLNIPYAIVEISVLEIDATGVGTANRAALRQAALALDPLPEHVLVDAFPLDDLGCSHDAIIRGDSASTSIALASIVAKVHRDALMTRLDEQYPEYGFAAHKGYGTAAHRQAIDRFGITCHHRTSFAPIAEALSNGPRSN
jgi:ribonuclease HII